MTKAALSPELPADLPHCRQLEEMRIENVDVITNTAKIRRVHILEARSASMHIIEFRAVISARTYEMIVYPTKLIVARFCAVLYVVDLYYRRSNSVGST